METVGEKVRRLRKERGMTQGDLAEITGITHKASISKIEHGAWIPGRDVAERLADALGVTPMELFGWTGSDGIPEEVASLMRNLTTEQQKVILAFVQFVKEGGLDGI